MPLLKLFLSPSRSRGSERRRSPTTSAVGAANGAGLRVAEIGQSASEVEQEASDVTLGAFKTTLRLVKECVDGLPAPGLKGALGGVLAVLEGIEATKNNAQQVKDLGSRLTELQEKVLTPLIGLSPGEATSEFELRVLRLVKGLGRVEQELGKLQSHGKARCYLNHRENALAIASLGGTIKDLIDTFLLGGFIAQEEQARQNRWMDLINSLPNTPARYNSAERSFASGCFENTRTDLLREIFSWIDSNDPNNPRIFWLSGLAGIGKSTIAQTVAEQCDQRGILGASFFFARQDTRRSNPLVVFSTIAHQLAKFNPSFRLSIARAVEANRYPADVTVETQLRDFIVTPLSKASDRPPLLVVVMDALDECDIGQDNISQLLRWLAAEIRNVPFLKFLITSRPEPPIIAEFSSPAIKPVTQSFLLHQIDASVIQGDIKRFLQCRLTEVGPSPHWPSERQLDALVAKSAGLFIFAKTSVDFIRRYGPDSAPERLNILLQVEDDENSSPYASLDKLYLQVLRNAISVEDDEHHALLLLFHQVVGAIVLLYDPLPVVVLERWLQVKQGRAKRVLRLLGSVIVTPQNDCEVVRAFHPSFPDFVTNRLRCSDEQFFIDPADHHQRLVLACFKCMASLKRDICEIKDPSKLNSEIDDLQARVDVKVSRELQYSCQHWASHLSHSLPSDSTLESLRSFCFTHLLHWLEVLSILCKLNLAVRALRVARQWCTNAGADEGLLSILADGERFVLTFFLPICRNAQRVYHHSARLPLALQNSLLFRTFKVDPDSTITVAGFIEDARLPLALQYSLLFRTYKVDPDSTITVAGFIEDGDLTSPQLSRFVKQARRSPCVKSINIRCAPVGRCLLNLLFISCVEKALDPVSREAISKITYSDPPIFGILGTEISSIAQTVGEECDQRLIPSLCSSQQTVSGTPMRHLASFTGLPPLRIRAWEAVEAQLCDLIVPLLVCAMHECGISQHAVSQLTPGEIHYLYDLLILQGTENSVAMFKSFFKFSLAEFRPNPSWPEDKQLDALVTKAAGMFVFAKTSVNFIGRHGPDAVQERLNILLHVDNDENSSPRVCLDKLYLQVLHDAICVEDDECYIVLLLFQQIVGAIVLLYDPLPVSALERLLQVKQGQAKRVLQLLGSVIVNDCGVVPAFHPSFHDFLTDRLRCSDERFFVNATDHHRRLALSCLECMISSFGRGVSVVEDLVNFNPDNLEACTNTKISWELHYSCRCWALHLWHSLPNASILVNLRLFCFKYLVRWLEVLTFFGWRGIAVSALETAKQWYASAGMLDELSTLLDGSLAFTKQCRQL